MRFSFVWGPNEACSLGDSIQMALRKLLQRGGGGPVGWGGSQVLVILVRRGACSETRVFADFC